MVTLSGFDRRLVAADGQSRDVTLEPGQVRWLDAQTHSGENIGETPTYVLFVELKEDAAAGPGGAAGPSRALTPTPARGADTAAKPGYAPCLAA